jgi:Right handed beta helix region
MRKRPVKFRNAMKHAPTPIEFLEPRIALATFLVTSLDDAGAGSLREAIATANDAPGRDLIVFEKGLTGVIALSTGEIAIKDALTIKGPGAAKLVINGQGLSRIFNVSDSDGAKDSPVGISGLSFFDGSTAEFGGAIQSSESLKIRACVFGKNFADRDGGAVLVRGPLASLDVRDSIFAGNRSNNRAGAIDAEVNGSVTLRNCSFHHNFAQIAAGAVDLAAGPGKLLLVEKSQFLNNAAGFAGAANLSGNFFDPPSKVVVRDSLFQGNRAFNFSVGAVQFDGGAVLFERNVVSQNTAAREGGGLVAANVDALKIKANRFLDNSAGATFNGGGLFIGRGVLPDRTVEIIGCIISGNRAREGGGIATGESDFTLKIIGTTLANNRAEARGGGLFIDADFSTQVGASVEIVGSSECARTARHENHRQRGGLRVRWRHQFRWGAQSHWLHRDRQRRGEGRWHLSRRRRAHADQNQSSRQRQRGRQRSGQSLIQRKSSSPPDSRTARSAHCSGDVAHSVFGHLHRCRWRDPTLSRASVCRAIWAG